MGQLPTVNPGGNERQVLFTEIRLDECELHDQEEVARSLRAINGKNKIRFRRHPFRANLLPNLHGTGTVFFASSSETGGHALSQKEYECVIAGTVGNYLKINK